jgi:YVTN family beta-propeller protein
MLRPVEGSPLRVARALALLGAVLCLAAAGGSGYRVLQRLEFGGAGGWDYPTIDPASKRLYLSRASHVLVADAVSGKILGTVPNTPGVHGIALVPELGRGVTSNGKTDTATIFDLKTLAVIATVKTGGDPDSILYETTTKRVFTFNGHSNDTTVIDPVTGNVTGTMALGGRPEFAVQDGAGKIFVDLIDTAEIVAFDARKLEVIARFPTAPGSQPSGLALDVKHHRLFSSCRSKHFVILDSDTGRVIATFPIGQGTDGAVFDAERKLAFASTEEGTLAVVREDGPDKFTLLENAPMDAGARTMVLDPKTHLLYLPTASFESAGKPKPQPVEGSFRVLVVGTKPK